MIVAPPPPKRREPEDPYEPAPAKPQPGRSLLSTPPAARRPASARPREVSASIPPAARRREPEARPSSPPRVTHHHRRDAALDRFIAETHHVRLNAVLAIGVTHDGRVIAVKSTGDHYTPQGILEYSLDALNAHQEATP